MLFSFFNVLTGRLLLLFVGAIDKHARLPKYLDSPVGEQSREVKRAEDAG